MNSSESYLRSQIRKALHPEPEASPVLLHRKRIYVLPTPIGFAMFGTLFIIFLTCVNYNLSLGYALLFLLSGVGVTHIIQSWRALMGMQISIAPEQSGHGAEVFAGDPATFALTLSHNGQADRPSLTLLSENTELVTFDVPAGLSSTQTFSLPTTERGWFRPGQFTLQTRYPLGWIRAWSVFELRDLRVLVLPRPEGELPAPTQNAYSEQGTPQLTTEDDFAGLRTHQPTDSPSRIAWKSLSKGTLMTKQFSSTTSPDWHLNWHALPAYMSEQARIAQLTRWALDARQQGLAVALDLPGIHLDSSKSPAHYHRCLEKLALWGIDDV